MTFLPLTWFDSILTERLFLTFTHFLWQGLAIALLALCFATVLRRASAQVRYAGFVAALMLMAACPVATIFLIEASSHPRMRAADRDSTANQTDGESQRPDVVEPVAIFPELVAAGLRSCRKEERHKLDGRIGILPPRDAESATGEEAGPFDSAWASLVLAWQAAVPYAVCTYLLGVLLFSLRLLVGLHGGWILRRRSEAITDPNLLDAIARRVKALRLRSAPAVRFCRDVAIPTVVGVIRPAVLLPVSLATGLTTDQIDAVLTHELAHIRRFDHLVNLSQRVIESLLFFHPAVWWVSQRIRVERENCCDDLVVALGAEPLTYAESLLSVAARNVRPVRGKRHAVATLTATGKISQLGHRIRRLIGAPAPHSLRLTRGGIAALVTAVVLAGFGSAYLGGRADATNNTETPGVDSKNTADKANDEKKPGKEDDKTARSELQATKPVTGEWTPPGKLAEGTGFRLRLRSSRGTWRAGETPKLALDFWNDTRSGKLLYSGFQQTLALEFDGKWYRWGDEFHIDSPVQVVMPQKKKLAAVAVTLIRSWVRVDKPRSKETRLALAPGKHAVRVAMSGRGGEGSPASGLVSGLLTIEIAADDGKKRDTKPAGFGPVVERVVGLDFSKTGALDIETGKYVAYNSLDFLNKKPTDLERFKKVDIATAAGESDTRVRQGIQMVAIPVDSTRWNAAADEIRKAVETAKPKALVRFGVPPRTYFIKTREGSIGVLQVTGFIAKDSGVKIRYKLVRTDAANDAKKSTVDTKIAGTTTAKSPRETVAQFLSLIRGGRDKDAWALTAPGSHVGWGPELTGLREFDSIRPLHQASSKERAVVVSNRFRDNSGRIQALCAVLRKHEGKWLIDRHHIAAADNAFRIMDGFAVHPGVHFGVIPAQLVGRWRVNVCAFSLALAADGTGSELAEGPGGPKPGAKPQPFKWKVKGNTLTRSFADRVEKLKIQWIDDNSVRLISPSSGAVWGWHKIGRARGNRRFVCLVVGKNGLTFDGQPTTWKKLPGVLGKIPNRANTVFEFAFASDDFPNAQKKEIITRCVRFSEQFGFEYPSDTGVKPLGSKGSSAPKPSAGGAKPSEKKEAAIGGKTVQGLKVSISFAKPRFTTKGPITVTWAIKNVSDKPRTILWHPLHFNAVNEFRSGIGAAFAKTRVFASPIFWRKRLHLTSRRRKTIVHGVAFQGPGHESLTNPEHCPI